MPAFVKLKFVPCARPQFQEEDPPQRPQRRQSAHRQYPESSDNLRELGALRSKFPTRLMHHIWRENGCCVARGHRASRKAAKRQGRTPCERRVSLRLRERKQNPTGLKTSPKEAAFSWSPGVRSS